MAEVDVPDELLDYEEEVQEPQDGAGDAAPKKDVKGTYVSIHSSGFRDFLLKPELLRAIVDCGFEHPSEGENMNPIADLQWSLLTWTGHDLSHLSYASVQHSV